MQPGKIAQAEVVAETVVARPQDFLAGWLWLKTDRACCGVVSEASLWLSCGRFVGLSALAGFDFTPGGALSNLVGRLLTCPLEHRDFCGLGLSN